MNFYLFYFFFGENWSFKGRKMNFGMVGVRFMSCKFVFFCDSKRESSLIAFTLLLPFQLVFSFHRLFFFYYLLNLLSLFSTQFHLRSGLFRVLGRSGITENNCPENFHRRRYSSAWNHDSKNYNYSLLSADFL